MQSDGVGSIRPLRSARGRGSVRFSSAAASLLYPATSAARIAASFLVPAMNAPHGRARLTWNINLDAALVTSSHTAKTPRRRPVVYRSVRQLTGAWTRFAGRRLWSQPTRLPRDLSRGDGRANACASRELGRAATCRVHLVNLSSKARQPGLGRRPPLYSSSLLRAADSTARQV
jgi:hypothetical protein